MSDNEVDMRELGRLGGLAKEANRRAAVVEAARPGLPLETLADAKKRLEVIQNLAITGKLSGSQAGAAVRGVEVWIRAHQAQIEDRIEELEQTVRDLERQLSTRRGDKRRV